VRCAPPSGTFSTFCGPLFFSPLFPHPTFFFFPREKRLAPLHPEKRCGGARFPTEPPFPYRVFLPFRRRDRRSSSLLFLPPPKKGRTSIFIFKPPSRRAVFKLSRIPLYGGTRSPARPLFSLRVKVVDSPSSFSRCNLRNPPAARSLFPVSELPKKRRCPPPHSW